MGRRWLLEWIINSATIRDSSVDLYYKTFYKWDKMIIFPFTHIFISGITFAGNVRSIPVV
jgi:hypothetical protein